MESASSNGRYFYRIFTKSFFSLLPPIVFASVLVLTTRVRKKTPKTAPTAVTVLRVVARTAQTSATMTMVTLDSVSHALKSQAPRVVMNRGSLIRVLLTANSFALLPQRLIARILEKSTIRVEFVERE